MTIIRIQGKVLRRSVEPATGSGSTPDSNIRNRQREGSDAKRKFSVLDGMPEKQALIHMTR